MHFEYYNMIKDANQPSPIGEGAICHPELCLTAFAEIYDFVQNVPMRAGSQEMQSRRGQSDVHEMLKLVQHDGINNPLPQSLPRGREAAELSSRYILHHLLKRTYSLINLFSYSPRKRAAFTLAEVLITLGIIGVVAALTIPNLITDYRHRVVETRLKKFYSMMNQAILQSINDNGEVENWSYFNNDIKDEEGNTINQSDKNDASFKKYLAPYLKIIHQKESKDIFGGKTTLYFLADGSAFHFTGHENRDIFFYPKNPEKCIDKTNNSGSCSFAFEFYPISKSESWKYLYKKGMEPTLYQWDGNENTLYNDTERGCNQNTNATGAYCTAIIQRNGWKIPKNYPRKISF